MIFGKKKKKLPKSLFLLLYGAVFNCYLMDMHLPNVKVEIYVIQTENADIFLNLLFLKGES